MQCNFVSFIAFDEAFLIPALNIERTYNISYKKTARSASELECLSFNTVYETKENQFEHYENKEPYNTKYKTKK